MPARPVGSAGVRRWTTARELSEGCWRASRHEAGKELTRCCGQQREPHPVQRSGHAHRAPERAAIKNFKDMVEAQGLNVTVRDTRGREADAACGQLHERVMRGKVAVG